MSAPSLVVIGVCDECGAQQLDNDMILISQSQSKCTTHHWRSTQQNDQEYRIDSSSPPPHHVSSPGGGLNSMPYVKECAANDDLETHRNEVVADIGRTEETIQRLQQRQDRWTHIINEECDAVTRAVEGCRSRLLNSLEDLANGKMDTLNDQLAQFTHHHEQCQEMLAEIQRRINNVPRTTDRCQAIVSDTRATQSMKPVLAPVPIEMAAECQMQPFVQTLKNFGGILESSLGRLPMVQITSTNISQGTVAYTVQEMDDIDADEKQSSMAGFNLQVEIQASMFGHQSLGWEILARNFANCARPSGTMTLSDVKKMPRDRVVLVRARTIIFPQNDVKPVRISAWSGAVEMERPAAPPKPFIVRMVDPMTNNKFPFKTIGPDFVGDLQNAAVNRWEWQCAPSDVELQIVGKSSKDIVLNLTAEEYPNDAFMDAYEQKQHDVYVSNASVEVALEPEPEPDLEPTPISLPARLAVKLRADDPKGSPQAGIVLILERRAVEGDWMRAIRQKFQDKWELSVDVPADMYFVNDGGDRIRDIREDADFVFAKEDKVARVVCKAL